MEVNIEEEVWNLPCNVTCDKCHEEIEQGDNIYMGRKSFNIYCHACGTFLDHEEVEVDDDIYEVPDTY